VIWCSIYLPRGVDNFYANCHRNFGAWPWAKVQIRAEGITAAVAMFRFFRLTGSIICDTILRVD